MATSLGEWLPKQEGGAHHNLGVTLMRLDPQTTIDISLLRSISERIARLLSNNEQNNTHIELILPGDFWEERYRVMHLSSLKDLLNASMPGLKKIINHQGDLTTLDGIHGAMMDIRGHMDREVSGISTEVVWIVRHLSCTRLALPFANIAYECLGHSRATFQLAMSISRNVEYNVPSDTRWIRHDTQQPGILKYGSNDISVGSEESILRLS